MRILLLGEYSSLHKYLKEGLQELGMEVMLAANGDGWKKIPGSDMPLVNYSGKGLKNIYSSYMEPWKLANSFKNFDVVQLVEPLPYPFLINTNLIKWIKKRNRCMSLVSAGGDYGIVRAYLEGKFEYYICDYDKHYLDRFDASTLSGCIHINSALNVEKMVDVIVPIHYEYAVGYNTNKLTHVIPFGLDLKKIQYKENKVSGKIIIFHGLNSELKKGTPFIREAMERLKRQYPNEVEIILDGHMPFDKYIEVMNKANVVIDQCCGYGYGINAGLAMAQGKVVMSGARKETLGALGVNKSPIIHIKPDADYIYEQLIYIVENRTRIPQWGYESRKYVEDIHDYIKIAQQYLDVWRATGKVD